MLTNGYQTKFHRYDFEMAFSARHNNNTMTLTSGRQSLQVCSILFRPIEEERGENEGFDCKRAEGY